MQGADGKIIRGFSTTGKVGAPIPHIVQGSVIPDIYFLLVHLADELNENVLQEK